MNNNVESFVQAKILPDLEKSRGGFDAIHTLEAVDWLNKIFEHTPSLNLDKDMLIIATYAHDWGYAGIFADGEVMTAEKIGSAKSAHMEIGAQKIAELLKDETFDFLNNNQKKRIVHLVSVHDKKYEIKDDDERVLMEADMLSGINVNSPKAKFDAASNVKFMDSILNVRLPKFLTEYGKTEAKRLIAERVRYYEQNR
jgi:hypothetical protein